MDTHQVLPYSLTIYIPAPSEPEMPPATVTPAPELEETGESMPEDTGSNAGLITGIVIAVIIVAGALVYFFIRRKSGATQSS